jgi:hypothetical protein
VRILMALLIMLGFAAFAALFVWDTLVCAGRM